MKKIKNFCKKNYIAIIIFISGIILIIGSILIINLIKANKNKIELKEENHKLYYYIGDSKISSNYKVKYENDKIVSIKNNKYTIGKSAITYYDSDELHAILPVESEIVFPNMNSLYKSLDKYSEIYKVSNSNIVINKGKKINSSKFFIYDGEDLYFFPYATTVTINGTTYELSEYSYVFVNPVSVSIYDKANDNMTYIEDKITSASAVNDYYKVDLYNDTYIKDNSSYSLKTDIDILGVYKEA